jgi:L-aminopeptidase/D-esterase-like protein
VKLTTPLASDKNKVEDVVRGTLVRAIVVEGETVAPAGTGVAGSVVEDKESGRVKGRALIAFEFNRITIGDETLNMRTARVSREAAHNTKSDVKKGAIGAGAGALVGALIGGGKGAAIGAGVGGAGAVVATKGDEVHLPAGTTVSTRLQDPLKVMVPVK